MRALILLLLLSLPVGCVGDEHVGNLVNDNVRRSIEVTGQVAKHSLNVRFQNKGSGLVDAYYLAFTQEQAALLSHISATDDNGEALEITLALRMRGGRKAVYYKVNIAEVHRGQTGSIKLQMIFSRTMRPLPARIAQDDPHLVVFEDNHLWFSPYKTESLWSEVVHGSFAVEDYSKHEPTKKRDGSIEYGPYSQVDAYSSSPLTVHFASKAAFVTATTSEREVQVSHWGSVHVVDTVELLHTGAALKDTFSRVDFQANPGHCPSVVRFFHAYVPLSASGIYYRDEIGNISTSHVTREWNRTHVVLQPRFPLFGGWRTAFTVGYTMPLHAFLASTIKDSSVRRLSVDFGLLVEGLHADRHTVRVVLPEGAEIVTVKAPFEVVESRDVKWTYLDTSGRPVVVLSRDNVISGVHDQPVAIYYRFDASWLLVKPLLCAMVFFVLMLIIVRKMRLETEDSVQHDLVTRFVALHTKRRKERASMASKWTNFHMKNGDKAELKAAKAQSKEVMDKLAAEGEALVEACSVLGKDAVLPLRVRTANLLEKEMAELRAAMYSESLVGAEAERCAVKYQELQEKAERTLENL